MYLDHRRIQGQICHILIQGLKYAQKGSHITPFTKPTVYRFPWSILFRDICSSCSAADQPQHGIHHQTVIFSGTPHSGFGNQISDTLPWFICQFITSVSHFHHPIYSITSDGFRHFLLFRNALIPHKYKSIFMTGTIQVGKEIYFNLWSLLLEPFLHTCQFQIATSAAKHP